MSELEIEQVRLETVSDVLARILIQAGITNYDLRGPELILMAEDYLESLGGERKEYGRD